MNKRIVTPQKSIVRLSDCQKSTYQIHLKSKQAMNYDITHPKTPMMPTPGDGTKSIQILL